VENLRRTDPLTRAAVFELVLPLVTIVLDLGMSAFLAVSANIRRARDLAMDLAIGHGSPA
jgi:hypothetical protein